MCYVANFSLFDDALSPGISLCLCVWVVSMCVGRDYVCGSCLCVCVVCMVMSCWHGLMTVLLQACHVVLFQACHASCVAQACGM